MYLNPNDGSGPNKKMYTIVMANITNIRNIYTTQILFHAEFYLTLGGN